MSNFDSFGDTPNQIKTEGEKITLLWKPSVPNNEQGTLEWNIPSPARGCATIASEVSAYCGIVIVVRLNSPVDSSNIPVDGVKYQFPDPSVNPTIHSGDKIGDAMVVGAFYEGDKKAKQEELTTSLIVSDLDSDKSYYFAAYAVTCQLLYHKEGVRAYSSNVESVANADTASYQTVQLGSGVESTDSTMLDPTRNYEFDLFLSDSFPANTGEQTLHFNIPGGTLSPQTSITYGDLVDEINNQVALSLHPLQSPSPPNTGMYYCNNQALYLWDGHEHVLVEDVITEPTAPSDPVTGEYWYTNDTKELKQLNTPLAGWNVVDYLMSAEDPHQFVTCDNIWFDGTNAYTWCSPTWCEENLIIDENDPSLPEDIPCCTHWFDQLNFELKEWNSSEERWVVTAAIDWPEAPNNLSEGTFWFDLTNNNLFSRISNSWSQETAVIISCSTPIQPIEANTFWYNNETEELFMWSGISGSPSGVWIPVPVLVWPTDPTDISSCDKWWDLDLKQWDSVNLEWDTIANFYNQPEDPRIAATIPKDTLWYVPSTEKMYKWDGQQWFETNYINSSADPTLPVVGNVWYDFPNNIWYRWEGSPANWVSFNPIDTNNDPILVPQGTLWLNSSTKTLYQRIGLSWIPISCSSSPLNPSKDDLWFDTMTHTLYVWDGSDWTEYLDVPVIAELTKYGHLQFKTTATGSSALVMVVVPLTVDHATSQKTGYGCDTIYSEIASHSFAFYENYNCDVMPTTDVTAYTFLFNQIGIAKIFPQYHGYDAVSNTPSYAEIGIGTDGTPDERRALMNTIRVQLGYPSIDVELTNEQLDTAVRKALDKFRQISTTAYKMNYFFIDVIPGKQHYILTNKQHGFHRIVNIMAAYRFTSAFLSTAHGSGVYGQVVLQHLYNMGTYDLSSYHLISQYIEQLEHLFATRIVFNWIESERRLSIFQSFVRPERLLLETTTEKTEQEILVDRWSKNWIERWALAESRYMLSEIRGKYSTLPGAGGGISLNATDLKTLADQEQAALLQEIDDFVANTAEDVGLGGTFIIG